MNTDPIADMLTRIRNANIAKHSDVQIPCSNLKLELAKLLQSEGFISGYEVCDAEKFKMIKVALKYDDAGLPVITNLRRVSRPGLRDYKKSKKLPKVMDGLGIAIISTSKGLLTDRKAKKENVGGEVLCYVW
ncbi:MAG: 30S ribosomal protein S8 [Candidatus Gastranaerophilales bacterium]|nr:30S ribosomal protein S8 [Candidatus Gastranaerophilales bacterium]